MGMEMDQLKRILIAFQDDTYNLQSKVKLFYLLFYLFACFTWIMLYSSLFQGWPARKKVIDVT